MLYVGFPQATNAGIPGEVTLTLHNRRRSDSRRVAVPPVAVLPRVAEFDVFDGRGASASLVQRRWVRRAERCVERSIQSAPGAREDGPLSVLRLALFSGFMVRKACGRLSPRKAVHSTIKGVIT
jgi:hypothetical protein